MKRILTFVAVYAFCAVATPATAQDYTLTRGVPGIIFGYPSEVPLIGDQSQVATVVWPNLSETTYMGEYTLLAVDGKRIPDRVRSSPFRRHETDCFAVDLLPGRHTLTFTYAEYLPLTGRRTYKVATPLPVDVAVEVEAGNVYQLRALLSNGAFSEFTIDDELTDPTIVDRLAQSRTISPLAYTPLAGESATSQSVAPATASRRTVRPAAPRGTMAQAVPTARRTVEPAEPRITQAPTVSASTPVLTTATESVGTQIADGTSLLHIYRARSMAGAAVGYDVRMGDEVVYRARNNSAVTIPLTGVGVADLWAKTESRSGVSFAIEPGSEYWVRCGIKMGAFAGRPVLEVVDAATGRAEMGRIPADRTDATPAVPVSIGVPVVAPVAPPTPDVVPATVEPEPEVVPEPSAEARDTPASAVPEVSIPVTASVGTQAAPTRQELKLYKRIMKTSSKRVSNIEWVVAKNMMLLENEELLTQIAKNHSYVVVRDMATEKVDDEEYLIQIAMNSMSFRDNWRSTAAAVRKIRNENNLIRLFLNSRTLTGGYLLNDRLQQEYPNLITPAVATKMVGNPLVGPEMNRLLIEKLVDDQQFLYDILFNDDLAESHSAAIDKLTDQTILAEVVGKHSDWAVYMKALDKLTDQNILANIAKTHSNVRIVFEAIRMLTDQNALVDIVVNHENPSIRASAMEEIYDQSLLMNLVVNVEDQRLRRMAFTKLDSASLETIVATLPKGDPMAVAARVATKTSDWSTEINNPRQPIDNVIGAMALVSEEVKPSSQNIVDACHKYIRKGDESKIPDLEFLLNNYGDVRLAEDYLNCGNRRLYDIGAEWARSHGYNIGSGWGSNRATWGSGR